MKIRDMHWQQVAAYLRNDDRAVLPLGSTEQHAQLSLEVDRVLAERVANEAAEPLGVPVFAAVPYGLAPYFTAYPGTLTLRTATYVALVRDLLDSLADSGFLRILIVNGHGGNRPAANVALEFMNDRPDVHVKWHDWWAAPEVQAVIQEIEPGSSHGSWMENFPWTRLAHAPAPSGSATATDLERMRATTAAGVRELLGDGNMGGSYQRSDEETQRLWSVGVQATRAALEGPWS